MISFNELPTAVENLQTEQAEIKEMLAELLNRKQVQEQPINSKELMKRLDISEPTLIAMRKRSDFPYFNVRGHFRYDYQAVIKALENKKGGKRYE